MHEMSPSLAVDGVMNTEMKALRAKSPEPPMPFWMREPITWVEFTVPKMSASISPFMAMQPRRRISSGWLEISCGRRISLPRNWSIRWFRSAAASGLSDRAVAEATVSLPDSSSSSIPSCNTSV